MALVGTFLYLAVYRLYPYDIAIEEVTTLLPAMLLFSLYYNALCFLLERLISHLFGLIIPVLLYLIVMLQSEVILDTTHRFTPMDIIQIVIPDIMIMELGYGFLFGATMVFSIALLWLVIGLLFVRKQDAI